MTQTYQEIPRHPARPPESELLAPPKTWRGLFQQLRRKGGLRQLVKPPTVGERRIYFHGLCDTSAWTTDQWGWQHAPWSHEGWAWSSEPERWPTGCGREDLRFLRSGGMSSYEGSPLRLVFFEVISTLAPELAADLPRALKGLHEALSQQQDIELALKRALTSVRNRFAQRVAAAEQAVAHEEAEFLLRVNGALKGKTR